MQRVGLTALEPDWADDDDDADFDFDDETPLELDDVDWDALVPDDDYEPAPDRGDFWTENHRAGPAPTAV